MDEGPRDPLFQMLNPNRLTAVVDIGANPMHNAPRYRHLLDLNICTVTGFEPQQVPLFELNRRKGPRETYLPYAIGDGRERTLHLCRARDMSSLLEPDPEHLALLNEFPKLGHVDQQLPIQTRRLDDIAEIEHLDFLKIDVQGAELEVFRSGKNKLAKAVAIQTEVSFLTLYKNQPTIGMIDTQLRDMGFIPHCFAEVKLWPLAPMVFRGNPRAPGNQVLEADLVYVRDFTRAANLDGEQWKHLALIVHHCYGSTDLALRALISAAEIGALQKDIPERYMTMVRNLAPR